MAVVFFSAQGLRDEGGKQSIMVQHSRGRASHALLLPAGQEAAQAYQRFRHRRHLPLQATGDTMRLHIVFLFIAACWVCLHLKGNTATTSVLASEFVPSVRRSDCCCAGQACQTSRWALWRSSRVRSFWSSSCPQYVEMQWQPLVPFSFVFLFFFHTVPFFSCMDGGSEVGDFLIAWITNRVFSSSGRLYCWWLAVCGL